MSEANFLDEGRPKLSTTLNVLTILTFIGCAYDLYNAIKNFTGGQAALEKLREQQAKLENAPGWAKEMAGPKMTALLEKGIENRVPLLIISLVGLGLCVFGAIEMRKLKKQGYTLWLAGELLPIIGAAIFLGGAFFNSFIALFLIFPLIFIILYTTQRKNLVY